MTVNPKPVIMLSSRTRRGSEITFQALALGAVDFVPKPSGEISLDIDTIAQELISKVKAAAGARVLPYKPAPQPTKKPAPLPRPRTIQTTVSRGMPADTVVVIGSSNRRAQGT